MGSKRVNRIKEHYDLNGELINAEITSFQINTREPFTMINNLRVATLLELSGSEFKMLTVLAILMNKKNVCSLNNTRRLAIAKKLNVNVNQLHYPLNSLCDKGFIFREKKGEYFINPYYFSKDKSHLVELLKKKMDAISGNGEYLPEEISLKNEIMNR
jgi:predicted transcriptional regulator